MKCPSCGLSFPTPPPDCPNCGLTVAQLDRKFGIVPYYSRYVTDRSQQLTRREVEKLRKLLRLFEQKFPQIIFSVLLMNLGARFSISEYAFWFANRARFSGTAAVGLKNFDLVLFIDPLGRTVALIVGYGLETYLTVQDLQDALEAATASFEAGDFAGGIRRCIEFMTDRLREIAEHLHGHKSGEVQPATPATAAEMPW